MWKYFNLILKFGFPILYFYFKARKMNRKKAKYSLEYRYTFLRKYALKFNKIMKKNIKAENLNIMTSNHNNRLYIINHQSIDDIITLIALSEKPLVFISKIENQNKFFIKDACGLIDTMYIDRDDPRQSLKIITEAAKIINENNLDLVLFPEGTRSLDLVVHEFKSALANLVSNAKVETVMVAINNTYKTLSKKYPYKKFDVQVKFFEPLSYDYFLENRREFVEFTHQQISQQVEKFIKES